MSHDAALKFLYQTKATKIKKFLNGIFTGILPWIHYCN